MTKEPKVYAFIDGANIAEGMKSVGWYLNDKLFLVYLKDKYGVSKAYSFLGPDVPENKDLYENLKRKGYEPIYKRLEIRDKDGNIKGNCDAELIFQAMLDDCSGNLHGVVIVAGDGDYCCLIEYFEKREKLKKIIAARPQDMPHLMRRKFRHKVLFLKDLRSKLEFKKKVRAWKD